MGNRQHNRREPENGIPLVSIPFAIFSTVPGLERPSLDLLSWKPLYTSVRPAKTGLLCRKASGASMVEAIVTAAAAFAIDDFLSGVGAGL